MDERDDNDLDYHLNDPEEIKQMILNNNRKKNIITWISIVLFVILVGVAITFVILLIRNNKKGTDDKQNTNEDKKNANENKKNANENKNNTIRQFNFTILSNLSYGEDKIENTFKIKGANYNKKLENINKGEDYTRNSNRNIYDLYIPYKLDKNKYNKILLIIHGGAWKYGDKSVFTPLCIDLAKQGYITASMDHTFINDTNNNPSIFRILDEVASVIKSIKKNLKDKGFNETKLELAIGGASSGAHIALLYAYSYKKSPLDIKFVINMVAPVTLESQYYYKSKNPNDTLEKIDEEYIKKYEEEKRIVSMNNSLSLAENMNLFLGYKKNDNLDQMVKPTNKNEIDIDSQKYKELLEKAQLTFPVTYVDKNTLPTICLYTGKDFMIGIKHYSYLKSKFDKAENKNINLIYQSGLPHEMYVPGLEKEFFEGQKKLFGLISNYSSKYFTQNNK